MRIATILSVVLSIVMCASAQDAGTLAAQQAAQAAQQANTMATQAAQQAAQSAQAAQAQATPSTQFTYPVAARPKFSAKGGTYSSPVTVKIKDSARGAVIYYTTDGWTPTTSSTRYTGPITISSTTTLQAMAIIPQLPLSRSRLATASYKISGAQWPAPTVPSADVKTTATLDLAKPMLPRGMTVPLVFSSDVTSRTADVGDKISLALADDIKVGNVILVKKGTPVVGTVTEADKARSFGRPGEVFFQVDYLQIDGTTVKLNGSAALEGRDKVGTAIGLAAIPPGIGGFLTRGDEAEIASGTPFLATVDADTPLSPAN
jgi:hypothetical protein